LVGRWIVRGLLVGATTLMAAAAYTHSAGPPTGVTGSPADRGATCNQPGCHQSKSLNVKGGSVVIGGVPDSYVPGARYTLTVQVQKPGQSRWGFELTATNMANHRVGQFTITDKAHTRLVGTRITTPTATNPVYVEQSLSGTFARQRDAGPVWSFDWTAPASGVGLVTFYAAGNAANNNDQPTGDFIYTTSAKSAEGAPSIVYGDVDGDGQVTLADAILTLRIAIGLIPPTPTQLAAGDVAPVPGVMAGQRFGDGKITLADAIRVLARASGLAPDPFP
jgi:hypothetical protein